MNKSRTEILTRLRGAACSESDTDDSILNVQLREEVNKNAPQGRDDIIGLFQKELDEVSAEFVRVGSIKEAADEVRKIVLKQGFKKIAVSGEKECKEIGSILKKGADAVQVLRVNEFSGKERKNKIAEVPVALVQASFGVADIGTLVFLYDDTGTSYPHFLVDTVIALLYEKDVTADQFELFEKLPEEKVENMVFVSGPSRTADIEKILILGAHGPKRLIVVMID